MNAVIKAAMSTPEGAKMLNWLVVTYYNRSTYDSNFTHPMDEMLKREGQRDLVYSILQMMTPREEPKCQKKSKTQKQN